MLDTDPTLSAALSGETDAQIAEVTRNAIESLRETDCMAFWLQAVGDGTPLGRARENQVEQATPHNAYYLAGYDDELPHPAIAQLSKQLFAHHLCLFSRAPDTPDLIEDFDAFQQHARETVRDTMNHSTVATKEVYLNGGAADAPDLDTSRSLDTQRERALTVLEEEGLSMFWLQILTHEQVVSIGPSLTDGMDIETMDDTPIEYFQVWPRAASPPSHVSTRDGNNQPAPLCYRTADRAVH